jgi:hypothetical protein
VLLAHQTYHKPLDSLFAEKYFCSRRLCSPRTPGRVSEMKSSQSCRTFHRIHGHVGTMEGAFLSLLLHMQINDMKSSFSSILLLLQSPFLSRLSHGVDMRGSFLSSRSCLRHNKSTASICVYEQPVYSKSTLGAVNRPCENCQVR